MAGEGKQSPRRKVKKKRSAKRRMQALRARRRLRAMGLGALGLLAGIGLLWGGFALSTGEEGDRMSPFDEAPASVHDDLLYLTYIDSFARDDRAVPTGVMEGGTAGAAAGPALRHTATDGTGVGALPASRRGSWAAERAVSRAEPRGAHHPAALRGGAGDTPERAAAAPRVSRFRADLPGGSQRG